MQRQATPDTTAYRHSQLSPQFLLRVGGLPISTVERLRFEETNIWINLLHTLESQLMARKEPLVDLLHGAVSLHKEDRDLRRLLINFKRNVFNMHAPGDTAQCVRVAHTLSRPGQVLLQEWIDLWHTYKEARIQLEHIFQFELSQKRAQLKETIGNPDFRKGLLLASPSLAQFVDAYLVSNNENLNREARTVERSLLEYLQRAACKTSPFSTLTSVCAGSFSADEVIGGQDIYYQISSMQKQSFTNLNLAIISRVSALILTSPELWRTLPVRLTTGWQRQKNRIRYVRRKQQVKGADEEAAVVIDIVHEDLFYLPVSRCLDMILHVLQESQELSVGKLVEHICQHPAYRHAEALVVAYVQHLLRLGLLTVPLLHLNIHSQQPLRDYCEQLFALQAPLAQHTAHHLLVVDSLVTDYATASVEQRQQLLTAIHDHVRIIYTDLGQPETRIPRTLLYEDTLLHPEQLTIHTHAWDDVLTDLDELQQLLPVFDLSLPKKLVTRGYFQARYGTGARCDDFLAFANTFNHDFFLQYARESLQPDALDDEGNIVRYGNHLQLPAIERLNDARQAVMEYLRQAFRTRPANQTSLVLDSTFFNTISAQVPAPSGPQTHALFSQFARVDGEPLLIINRMYSGLTAMFSRFARYFSEAQGYTVVPTLRATLTRLQPPGAVFAELKGGYETTNLNLHPHITAYELVCPGESSHRPLEEQIPLTDLYLQDDPASGSLRLYSRRLNKEVIPLYLGFLLPMMLPDIQQVLLNFSCISFCFPNFWLGVEPEASDQVMFYPRLRYKHLLLQRAMWKMPVEAFPQRASKEADIDFYLHIQQWRKKHHLPDRLFISISTPNDPDIGAKAGKVTPTHKPMFVDFTNYFSMILLESTLRKASGQLTLSEMLPAPEHLWLEHEGESYVAELLLEINNPAKEKAHHAG